MLRAIAAAIRSAMKMMARLVLVTVEIGGRMVSMFRIEPQFSYDTADTSADQVMTDPAPQAQVPAASELQRIRDLATNLARRPDMTASEIVQAGVPATTAAWMAGMRPVMLCRIALSSDADLKDAIAGRKSIRGVYPHGEMRRGNMRKALEDGRELEAEAAMNPAFV